MAATLSSPGNNSVNATTANVTCASDTAGGTLYEVATVSNVQPTNTQIEAGQDASGTASPHTTVTAVSGANTLALTGLTPNQQYYAWILQDNGTVSNVVTTNFLTLPTPPSISGVTNTTPSIGTSITITGSNNGSVQGTVTIGGATQAITAWSTTSITITVDLGLNKHGVQLDLLVTNSTGSTSTPFTGITSVLPPVGWSFIDLGTVNITMSHRLTAVNDLVSGDQLRYDTIGGLVTVLSDASFSASTSVVSFGVYAWTSGSGWGTLGLQTVSLTSAVNSFNGAASSTIAKLNGVLKSLLSKWNEYTIS
jgi:hypothetical protein